jgi:hypothetical protein
MTCERTRALASELALGIADGAERADALEHLAACPECRRAVGDLTEVSDALLMVAPEHEPPVGFESRVLARLQPPPARRRSRRRRTLFALAPAALSAALATVVVLSVTAGDRNLAGQYRQALDVAHGSAFEAAPLQAAAGRPAGVVYAYRGTPSWVFVYLDPKFGGEEYRPELVLRSGRSVPLTMRIDPASWSGGQAITGDLRDVASVRLVSRTPGDVLEARLPADADDG